MSERDLSKSNELFQRAKRVIPGGVYGHQSPSLLVPGSFPTFISKAEGCRLTDPDGNEYIDFLCAYGPMVVGYRNPQVEEAVERQRHQCDSGNLPAPNMVELAERLVGLTPGIDWTVFAKNGSDAASWSLAIARAATGRELVAMVERTYHGVHGWANMMHEGFPAAERANIVSFAWNDAEGLERLADEHAGKLAAVIVTPFKHEAFGDSVMPAPGFLDTVRTVATRSGAAMIVDDVRAGFRLDMRGSAQLWGVTPDMILYSKALANGYPLSAVLGNDGLRDAAKRVFVTGTFFTQAVPIAASLATLDYLEANDGIARMRELGNRFCKGLSDRAEEAGLAVTLSGPPAIPFMTFQKDEGSFERSRVFAAACAARGVFVHPCHNWFVSTAHSEADVDFALDVAAEAFETVNGQFEEA